MGSENKVEDKIKQLDEKIAWFNSEDFSIGEALAKFKESKKLVEAIEKDLKTFKNKIEVIKQDFNK